MSQTYFEWDLEKDAANQAKHKISFLEAQQAFADPRRVITRDLKHSEVEDRYFCFGLVNGNVATVRFAYRDGAIRIIGAGYWRRGKVSYEEKNRLHR